METAYQEEWHVLCFRRFAWTYSVINKSRLIFRLTIYWRIDRDAANIYRDTVIWHRINCIRLYRVAMP